MTLFGTPLPEHRQSRTKAERFRMLLQTDPSHLSRAALVRVLAAAPETARPKSYQQMKKADLLLAVQEGLKRVAVAYCIAPVIRLEYHALTRKRGKTDSA